MTLPINVIMNKTALKWKLSKHLLVCSVQLYLNLTGEPSGNKIQDVETIESNKHI